MRIGINFSIFIKRKKIEILILLGLIFTLCFKAEISLSQPRCSISGISIHFGSYNVFSPNPTDSTGTLTLNCEDVARADLKLSASSTSGTFNPRRMKRSGGNDFLDYNIFIDAGRTVIFGDGTGGTQTIRVHKPPGTPAKAPWSSQVNIYARIPPGQDVSIGSYSDSLTLTVEW